jgi:hypothetical protein
MDVETEAPKSTRTPSRSHLGLFAAAAAGLMALAWSARLVDSPDVGYHLAYGEHFLETGRIVDTNRWIYAELDPAALAHPDSGRTGLPLRRGHRDVPLRQRELALAGPDGVRRARRRNGGLSCCRCY